MTIIYFSSLKQSKHGSQTPVFKMIRNRQCGMTAMKNCSMEEQLCHLPHFRQQKSRLAEMTPDPVEPNFVCITQSEF